MGWNHTKIVWFRRQIVTPLLLSLAKGLLGRSLVSSRHKPRVFASNTRACPPCQATSHRAGSRAHPTCPPAYSCSTPLCLRNTLGHAHALSAVGPRSARVRVRATKPPRATGDHQTMAAMTMQYRERGPLHCHTTACCGQCTRKEGACASTARGSECGRA